MDRRHRHLHRAAYIASVLLALCVGALAFRYGRYHSGNALLSQAREEAADGRYAKAAQTVDRIISLRDSRVEMSAGELLLMKANYQYSAGEYSGAGETAQQLVSETSGDSDLSMEAAEIAVNAYKKEGNYDKIAAFLHDYRDRSFVSSYKEYLCEAPEINLKSGSYEENTKITIKGESGGTVYYTTDGTDPSYTGTSNEYQNSITLKKGTHEVRAVYVNAYGVTSAETKRKYTITSLKPDPPVISPESGIYYTAVSITASGDDDCEIRYTDDGTEPDENSTLYKNPIRMPSGSTTFRFVCVTKDGVISDEVSVTYSLHAKGTSAISEGSDIIRETLSDAAVALVKSKLEEGKTIEEIRGQTTDDADDKKSKKKSSPTEEEILLASYYYYNPASYYYSYAREVTLGSGTYYLYEENYVDSTGSSVKTGDLYAMNINTEEIMQAYSTGSSYQLRKISPSDLDRTDISDTSGTAAAALEP